MAGYGYGRVRNRMGIESPVHLLFIAAVALVVLGPKRLPEVARALGKGIREFREAFNETADGGEHTAETDPLRVSSMAQLEAGPENVSEQPSKST
jgi:TatA/E family protein of Tat protein translocase